MIFSCRNQNTKNEKISKGTSTIDNITTNSIANEREFKIAVSSELESKIEGQYLAANAFDNDPTTAWVEGSEGNGEGEWIEITFSKAQLIREMIIHNGYQKSEETYKKNNRMSSFSLYIDGKKSLIQSFNQEISKFKRLRLNQFVKKLKIQVDAVKKGTHYNDLCISDIKFVFSDYKFQNAIIENIKQLNSDKNIAFKFEEDPDKDRAYLLNRTMIFYDLKLASNKTQTLSLFEHIDFIDFHAEEIKTLNSSFPFYIVWVYLQGEYDFDTYLHFIPKYNLAAHNNIFHESASSSDGGFNYKEMNFVNFNKDEYDDLYFTGGDCSYSKCGDFKNKVLGISEKTTDNIFRIEFE